MCVGSVTVVMSDYGILHKKIIALSEEEYRGIKKGNS